MNVRTSKPARSRVRPPGPSAETRRLCVTSDSGLFWSMNWDSWLEPKNSLTAADTGLALIRILRHQAFASPWTGAP